MPVQMALKPKTTEASELMTGEDLAALGDIGPAELVKGKLVRMSPAGHLHGYYEVNVSAALQAKVRPKKLGRVLVGEVGIYIERNPDTVRGADVAFISNERLARVQSPSFLDVAPELVVEIMSPDDRWSEISEKIAEYFSIEVQMVWIVDPRRQQVHVYRSPTEVEILTAEETLSGREILPDFSVPVAELFE